MGADIPSHCINSFFRFERHSTYIRQVLLYCSQVAVPEFCCPKVCRHLVRAFTTGPV